MFFQDSTCQGWTWIEGYVDLFKVIEGLGQLPGGSVLSQWKQNGCVFFCTFTLSRLVALDWGDSSIQQKLLDAPRPQGNALT